MAAALAGSVLMPSSKINAKCPTCSMNMVFIAAWKVAGAFNQPKTEHSELVMTQSDPERSLRHNIILKSDLMVLCRSRGKTLKQHAADQAGHQCGAVGTYSQ
jgi:hypothetical protein